MSSSPKLRVPLACALSCSLFVTGLVGVAAGVARAPRNSLPPSFTPPAAPSADQPAPRAETPDEATREHVGEAYNKLPMSFEENRGQVDKEVRYVSRGPGYTLFLTPTEAVLSLRGAGGEMSGRKEGRRPQRKSQVAPRKSRPAVLRMRLLGANRSPAIAGEDVAQARANYFRGDDPQKWRTEVPRFERVRYSQVYPGVDMLYYGQQQQLEYDFEVAPGADTRQIVLEFTGVGRVKVERATGELVLKTAGGEVRQRKPVAYQEGWGERREVASRYVLKGRNRVGIEVGDYDRAQPLVIDPVLSYSTYLGGHSVETGMAIAVDASGIAYVAGYTFSDDFPTRSQYQTARNGGDVFVAKLDTNLSGAASLLYSTYLGGASAREGEFGGREYANGIAVDSAGIVYVTGFTTSTDFPTLNAYRTYQGDDDAFVVKLDTNAAGAASLLYSTYFGGSRADSGQGIAVDSAGNAYIVGFTNSPDLPTLHNFQAKQTDRLRYDAFIAKLDTNVAGKAALRYSTYFGGNHDDFGAGIAVDPAGYVYVVGTTYSTNLPTRNQFQRDEPSSDAFVAKLDTDLAGAASLLYSTYLGGNGYEDGFAIAVDQAGRAYVTGQTGSNNFPTLNAYQSRKGDNPVNVDAFIVKLDTNVAGAASLLYGTYLGGGGMDTGYGIAADSAGNAYVTGYTWSIDFPTFNAYQRKLGGYDSNDFNFQSDAFVVKLNTLALGEDSVVYSTYLGGSNYDGANSIAVDPAGNAYVTGYGYSTDFPLRRQYQRGPAEPGGWDAFVTKLKETYFIVGRVVRGGEDSGDLRGVGGVVVTLDGAESRRVVTDSEGAFAFLNLEQGGLYRVTPSKGDLAFDYESLFLRAGTRHNFIQTLPADISGRVTIGTAAGAGLGGVTLTLTGGQDFTPRTTETTSNGAYSFTDLPTPGGYRITASKDNYIFAPTQLTLTNLTANRGNVNLVATLKHYTVGGVVRMGTTNMGGVTVRLTSPTPAGFTPRTATTDDAGVYSFPNLPAGRNYMVTPVKTGYRFTPVQQSLSNLNANQTTVNFLVTVYSISGRVTRPGTTTGIGAVTITLTSPTPAGFPARTAQTSSTGYYTFTNLPAGRNYTLKPAKTGFTFSPTSRSILSLTGDIPAGASTSFTGTGP